MSRDLIVVDFPPEYPELLNDIGQVIARKLADLGFPAENAKNSAYQITETIRTELGGTHMYLPKGQSYELNARDREIYSRYTGRNLYELSRMYKLTEMQIRTIVKRGLARARARQQLPLLEE